MARYIGPVCRQCRREGMKLYLKGERCHSEKCAIEKRNFVPGQHGKDRKERLSATACNFARSRRSAAYMACWNLSSAARSKRPLCRRHHRRKSDGHSGAASGQRHLPYGFRHQPRPVPPDRAPRPHRRQRPQVRYPLRAQSRSAMLFRFGKAVRTIPRSWPPATLRLMLRRRTGSMWTAKVLKGRITSLPQRSELVQIQLNEQLIVELYSK